MGRILVGTASWTDKSLIASKRFYPPKCNSAEDRLVTRTGETMEGVAIGE